jgi:hypothetical protein
MGAPVHYLLHYAKGKLTSLERYRADPDALQERFPDPKSLQLNPPTYSEQIRRRLAGKTEYPRSALEELLGIPHVAINTTSIFGPDAATADYPMRRIIAAIASPEGLVEPPRADRDQFLVWSCGGGPFDRCMAYGNSFSDVWQFTWTCGHHRDKL